MKKLLIILLFLPFVLNAQSFLAKSVNGTDASSTGDVVISVVSATTLTDSLATKTNKLISIQEITQSDTLELSYADKLLKINIGSTNNISIPTNASVAFPIGTQILLLGYGAGQTTVIPLSGVTMVSSGSKTKLNAQHSLGTLIKIGTNEWVFGGEITN